VSDDDREDDDLARVLRAEPESLTAWLWARSELMQPQDDDTVFTPYYAPWDPPEKP
jgi:hypothetical protein